MTTAVISIGGSVLVPGDGDASYITSLAKVLTDLSTRHRLFVVTGGGSISRYYIETGRKLGMPEEQLDQLGILATRLNARMLGWALRGCANGIPPETVEGATSLSSKHRVVVMGGTSPGWTTDYVAAMLAKTVKADVIVNATAVDGVYSSDPKKVKDAKRFERMTYDQLSKLTGESHTKAGPSIVFDPAAAKLVTSMKIPLLVLNGRDLEALSNAVEGKPFKGTRIEDE